MDKKTFLVKAADVTKTMEIMYEGEWCLVTDYFVNARKACCITLIPPDGCTFIKQYGKSEMLKARWH